MTLVFDTETTGKADFKKPPEHPCQPRIVQLGAILFDELEHVRAEVNLIVKPGGFNIPTEATNIHGITDVVAEQYGMNEKAVLQLFLGMCRKAKTLVAHNIKFDSIVIGRALAIHGMTYELPPNTFCTMEATTDILRLPGPYGYKWPKLTEAYFHCFKKEMTGAHDAMADVRGCAEVYFWLKKQK